MHKKGSHPLPLRTPRTQFVHIQLGSSRCQQIGKKRLQLDLVIGHLFCKYLYVTNVW